MFLFYAILIVGVISKAIMESRQIKKDIEYYHKTHPHK